MVSAPGGKLDPVTAATPPFGLSRLGKIDDWAKRRMVQAALSVALHMPGPSFQPSANRPDKTQLSSHSRTDL